MMNFLPNTVDVGRLRALPKAEVHVHLEGSFGAEVIETLARDAGEALPRPRERLFEFSGLADFLVFLDWACALVRTREHLAGIARAFAARQRASGVGYTDAIINPSHWPAWRGRLASMIDALDAGFREAEAGGAPPTGLAISLMRDVRESEALALVQTLIALKHPRVVALSVDGNEAAHPGSGARLAPAFRLAGAAGLRRTAHAGESSGPQGVRDALDLLGAERIDHGVRAIDDPALVAQLAEHGVTLGVCPGSNLALEVYPDMAAHPIDRLRMAGVRVSVNTDDPALFATTLENEYARCVAAYGWDDDVLRQVARTSIEASFAPPGIRAALLARLAAW
jgi:adenosine deaminase